MKNCVHKQAIHATCNEKEMNERGDGTEESHAHAEADAQDRCVRGR